MSTYFYFDILHLTTIFQFVCPDPKGSKLKNQPVPFRDQGQKQVDFSNLSK